MSDRDPIWDALAERSKNKFDADRARFLDEALADDDGGWTKHTPYHWSRNINGVDEQDGIQAFGAGMTLRDYFAAKAMQTLMSHSGGHWAESKLMAYAITAYTMADAMLKAREQ